MKTLDAGTLRILIAALNDAHECLDRIPVSALGDESAIRNVGRATGFINAVRSRLLRAGIADIAVETVNADR